MALAPWTVFRRSSCLSVSLTVAAFFGATFLVAVAEALALGVPAFEAVAALTAGAFAVPAFVVAAFLVGAFFEAEALLALVVVFFTAIVSNPHIQGSTDQ